MSNCNCHVEITRDGSGRAGRYLRALDPSYAPVDDRSFDELLVFARRMAAQVRFYPLPEEGGDAIEGAEKLNWEEFFRRDMAVIAASIGVTDLEEIQEEYEDTRKDLEAKPDIDRFRALFDPIIGMMVRIDSWYHTAVVENPLYQDLRLGIASVLVPAVKKMRAYERGFYVVDPSEPLNLDFSDIRDQTVWGLDQNIAADPSIYTGGTASEKMVSGALYADDVFYTFFNYFSSLVNGSEKYMGYAMQRYPSHQPHMALFIAFLQLFRLLQEQANGLTEKMLDFYYKDVLHLEGKPSIPDRAFVVFELAKDVATYDLAKSTSLNAGKDSSGNDRTYTTTSDLVINQAKVKELKTIFVDKLPDKNNESWIRNIYARPIANSADGFGEKFTGPLSAWPTFGEGAPSPEKIRNPCDQINSLHLTDERKDITQVGFAIASPQLLMQGGKRLLQLAADGLKNLFSPLHADTEKDYSLYLTGQKGWVKVDRACSTDEARLLAEALKTGVFPAAYIESGYFPDEDGAFNIYLAPEEEPIISFDAQLHTGANMQTAWPVLRVMINPSLRREKDYMNLKLTKLSLRVKVGSILSKKELNPDAIEKLGAPIFDGLKELVIVNDTGIVPSNKPFDPFGSPVKAGGTFYIGSNEVFNKPLGELAVNLRRTEDVGDPTGRIERMAANRRGGLLVNVLDKREWHLMAADEKTYFTEVLLRFNILNTAKELKPYPMPRKPLTDVSEGNLQAIRGFISITNAQSAEADLQKRLNLTPEAEIAEISLSYDSTLPALDPLTDQVFHIYPFGVLETFPLAQQLARLDLVRLRPEVREKKNDEKISDQDKIFQELDSNKNGLLVRTDHLLPQFTFTWPYKFQDQAARYQQSAEDKRRAANWSSADEQMLRILAETRGIRDKYEGAFNQYSGTVEEEGMLFIGIEKLEPLQTISLLFQFAEGSAADEDSDPPKINWSYLTNNELRPMKDDRIVYDSTFGFQATGIVKIDVPEDISSQNTLLTGGLYWFMASVTKNSERIPRLVDVVAQAVEAVYQDKDTDPTHFDAALAAGTISKLSVAVADVSRVSQPFASFDGKPKEHGKEYYTRVSERLRHKGRAINAWDYEHLVLERFPSIYKVKCITHSDPNCFCRSPHYIGNGIDASTCCGPQIAPGHVLLVPIPQLRNRNAVNPLQPKTGRRTLLDIEAYISRKTSPFVKVHARNPDYEEVLVSFRVKFFDDIDKGYYLKKLNDEIVRFLTPWAFDENVEVKFGEKIYASSIINFIEERVYVDFITDFKMFVCRDACCAPSNPEREEVKTIGTKINSPEGEAVVVAAKDRDEELAATLNKLCGCADLEALVQSGDMAGQTVATPSTPRSILVSVEQHNILLYEEPEVLSPCEQKAMARTQVVVVSGTTGKEETKPPEKKKTAPKKRTPTKRNK